MNKTRIIILGCGFGGLAATQHLTRQYRDDLDITVFNRTSVLYNYPLLPRLLIEDLPEHQLNWPLEQLLDKTRIRLRPERITAIDFSQQTVATETENHPFDYLIIAPGGKAIPLDQDDGFTVYYPKATRHLLRLRDEIDTLCKTRPTAEPRPTIMIVGGGLTGIEFAASIRELIDTRSREHALDPHQLTVTLVEQAQRLAPDCHPRLSEMLLQQLTRRGIQVLTGLRVDCVHQDCVTTTGGELPVHRVVCCIGSQTDFRFKLCGLDSPDELIPTSTLQVHNQPHCFVVGDAAQVTSVRYQETKRASHAIHQGRAAARNVLNLIDGRAQKPYQAPHHPTLVTLDDRRAALEYRGFCFTGGWPARLKHRLETRYL